MKHGFITILETKDHSKQWTFPNERAPKKAKTVPSIEKIMATIFWDANYQTTLVFL